MITSKKVILISAGEPSSIATEITIKTIMSSKVHSDIMPIVITDPQIIINYFKLNKVNYEINEIKDKQYFKDFKKNKINIIPIKLLEKVDDESDVFTPPGDPQEIPGDPQETPKTLQVGSQGVPRPPQERQKRQDPPKTPRASNHTALLQLQLKKCGRAAVSPLGEVDH